MPAGEKPLYYLTIHEAQKLIRAGALSPVELTREVLKRIEALDGKLHAYLKLMAESALAEARRAEEEIRRGQYRGPLHGIPVAVKDQLDVKGAPAEIRTRVSEPVEDSAVVAKLRQAGAVMLGKLSMSSLPSDPPQARNPWDTNRITGGSSTGAGAGVAAGLCMGALGEDTAGSIRNPASLCGVVGLKPTFGRVSRRGLAPLCWSLDHCGPMTWVVEDAAYLLQTVAGYDPDDPASIPAPVPNCSAALKEDLKGMVVGVPRRYIEECSERTDPEIIPLVDKAIGELESLGARVQEVSAPTMSLAGIANAVIYYNEYFTAHRDQAAAILKSGAAGRRARMYLGLLTNSSDYIQAQRIRSRLKQEFAEVFGKVSLLALPCQQGAAPLVKDAGPLDTFYKHLSVEYHQPFNLAGLPAISVPCGFSRDLPVALQLVGKPFDEGSVLSAAYAYQQHAKWYEKRPPI